MRLAVKIALAVLVLCGAMYLFVFPARTYLAQKQDIVGQERTIAVLKAENTKLAAKAPPYRAMPPSNRSPAEYGLVKPGQQAFMVLPSPAPAPAPLRPSGPAQGPLVRVPGILASPLKDRP